ncbi:MAG: hypothetical protein IPK31_00925 [Chitinophagaceae bacterium]|nr:hypothetical protein [Chitinophagaceae bacterium]
MQLNTEVGLKIEMEKNWLHLRSSGTEPVIRVYTEVLMLTQAEGII